MYDELVKRLRNCATQALRCNTGFCTDILMTQAADAIEELQQIAAHYEETSKDYFKDACYYRERVPQWIPVSERLPEENGEYLVCGRWRGKPTEIWVCEFMALGCLKGWANNAANPVVSHWMPLPQPPMGKPTCKDCQRECQMMGLDMEACASYEPPKEET